MKMVETAKIRNILERYISKAMPAFIIMLIIRVVEVYIKMWVCFYLVSVEFLSICTYALKRIPNKVAHNRKFALFPGCARLDGNTGKDLCLQ